MAKKVLTPEQAEVKMLKKQSSSMKWTGFLAFLLAFVLVFSVIFVGKSGSTAKENTENTISTNTPGGPTNTPGGPEIVPGGPSVDENGNEVTDENADNSNKEPLTPQRELPEDPKEWTKEEIVKFYRESAQKSTSAKSTQTMTMNNGMNVKLNNSALEFLIEFAEPIIKLALKNNSIEFDGITGGYNSLVPSDVQSAKAYKDGDYTIVEMVMVEQTDDAYGDTYKGTVGHAISVVGNIAVVADNFPDWNVNFKDAFVELKYVNPVVKVKINKNGVIEKGTWSYVVNVHVKDLQIESVIVEEATTVIDYVIVTGGGF
ncbi:MAG: hypothetical protein IKV25_06930 [Clostridia bacterium]|nr:hypothetical protein [Clostridia bacterium]